MCVVQILVVVFHAVMDFREILVNTVISHSSMAGRKPMCTGPSQMQVVYGCLLGQL